MSCVLQVQGYPGMFRVIAWVLNGLMHDVHNATLSTDDEGIVTNRFWLTGERLHCSSSSP